MPDVLFDALAGWHTGSWGRFLDAGTGVASLQWAVTLECTSITAITADTHMQASVLKEVGQLLRPADRVLVGNWMDDAFSAQLGTFDTILADYLIGAVDGFSPYTQDLVLERLVRHLSPQGRLYIVGMHPVPDTTVFPASLVSEVRRARDAAILLGGHRPYREYPLEWMERHLARAHLQTLRSQRFTIMHSAASLSRQIKVGQSKLALMDGTARPGMESYLAGLDARVRAALSEGKRVPLSFDYVICAAHRNDATALIESNEPMKRQEKSIIHDESDKEL